QIESPVRWVETIQKMTVEGVTQIVECGPGKVLTGLNKRIVKSLETYSVYDPSTIRETISKISPA
ncbi:MAG: malonyl CoA-acyl carrier protein transacylase, partial [Gammaproteobacteria bacterium]|nr:malonyl CoA-acyl carrier protein transacylase [Gammaproteobacteria bacterium]